MSVKYTAANDNTDWDEPSDDERYPVLPRRQRNPVEPMTVEEWMQMIERSY